MGSQLILLILPCLEMAHPRKIPSKKSIFINDTSFQPLKKLNADAHPDPTQQPIAKVVKIFPNFLINASNLGLKQVWMVVLWDWCLNQRLKKLFCVDHHDPIRLSKAKEIFLMIPSFEESKQALREQ
jgi:hypothetical protein